MDPADVKDLEYYLAHYGPMLVVAILVYFGGVGAKKVVKIWVPDGTPKADWPMWYRLWAGTIDWHPPLVGGLLGLIPWPTPHFIGPWYVRVLWFAAVGAISGQVYRMLTKLINLVPEIARSLSGAKKSGSSPSDPGADPGSGEEGNGE